MVAVAEQQPAPDSMSEGATLRSRTWMRRVLISVLVLLTLRALAHCIGEFVPGDPWIANVERLLGRMVDVVTVTLVAIWIVWGDAPSGVLRRLLVVSIALVVTGGPPRLGLPAPWDQLAYFAWAFLILALSILCILYIVRGTATATQRDIDARLGIQRMTPR